MNTEKFRLHADAARAFLTQLQDFMHDLDQGGDEVWAGLVSGLIETGTTNLNGIFMQTTKFVGHFRAREAQRVLEEYAGSPEDGGLWERQPDRSYRLN